MLASRSAPKGAVSRDKGAMVKLSRTTYARIAQLLEKNGWIIEEEEMCDVCCRETRSLLEADCAWWLLCKHHLRAIGVLW